MPQNQITGAVANDYGFKTARSIAATLHANALSKDSNEFALQGRLLTIKCAQKNTTLIGVTYAMLERIDAIYGAFQNKKGLYEIFEMSPQLYRQFMRDSKHEGKVGLVRRQQFKVHGRRVAVIEVK